MSSKLRAVRLTQKCIVRRARYDWHCAGNPAGVEDLIMSEYEVIRRSEPTEQRIEEEKIPEPRRDEKPPEEVAFHIPRD